MDITRPISSWFWNLIINDNGLGWSWEAYYGNIELCSTQYFDSEKDAIEDWNKLAKKQCFCWNREIIPLGASDPSPESSKTSVE